MGSEVLLELKVIGGGELEVADAAVVQTRRHPLQFEKIEADGLLATCFQHEIDHLEGVLFVDHISKLKRNVILRKLQKTKKQQSAKAMADA